MKIVSYIGRIYNDARGIQDIDRKIFAVDSLGRETEIPERQNLVNHSPTGFCWGYHGSGPAQAALAILAHQYTSTEGKAEGERLALEHYQAFKSIVIANLPQDQDFEIPAPYVVRK